MRGRGRYNNNRGRAAYAARGRGQRPYRGNNQYNPGGREKLPFRRKEFNNNTNINSRRLNKRLIRQQSTINKKPKVKLLLDVEGTSQKTLTNDVYKLDIPDLSNTILCLENMTAFANNLATMIKHPHVAYAITRKEKVTINEDGSRKVEHVRGTLPFDKKVIDYDHVLKVLVKPQPLTAAELAAQNTAAREKYDAERLVALTAHNKARGEALHRYWLDRIGSGDPDITHANAHEGFVYDPFNYPEFVPITNVPAARPKINVTEGGSFAYKTAISSEVEVSMKVSEIPDKESNQQYLQYVKGLDQDNAEIAKLKLSFDTDMVQAKMYALSLCTKELQEEINAFAVNVLKIPVDDFNSNATFVELLNIIDAICHPFWLRHHSPKNTKEMLREMYTKLYNDNYITRKDNQTFSEYFRFMSVNFNHLQYIVKLVEDPLLNISESQYIRQLITKMRSKTNSETFDVHKRAEYIQQEVKEYKATLQEQIDDLKMYCKEDDIKITNARDNKNRDHNPRPPRRNQGNWDNRDANREAAQSLLNDTINEEPEDQQDEHVLISVGDINKIVSEFDIPPEKFEKAIKSKTPYPNQDKNTNIAGNHNGSRNPATPNQYNGHTPGRGAPQLPVRGGFTPRGGFIPRGGRGIRGRGTYAGRAGGGSYFNTSQLFTYYEWNDDNEGEANNNLSVQPSKVRRTNNRVFEHVPKATAYGAIVEDNGNTSNHIFRHIECFPQGVFEFEPNEIAKVSGQDAGWVSSIRYWGIHPIFGFSWYNEHGRVNLINPELLGNDGYCRSAYTDENGEFAVIYTKEFLSAHVKIEFIKNAEGHLIAMDPWLFEDRMNTPSMDEAATMGDINSLREFLCETQISRYHTYMKNRDRFISEHYQSIREANSSWEAPSYNNLANHEISTDDEKGRHRSENDDEQEASDTDGASTNST